jgi:hypothetical protein
MKLTVETLSKIPHCIMSMGAVKTGCNIPRVSLHQQLQCGLTALLIQPAQHPPQLGSMCAPLPLFRKRSVKLRSTLLQSPLLSVSILLRVQGARGDECLQITHKQG